MGLASSQGRLLMLTSRLSDIELKEIMISHRQNQLAWHAEEAAKEYNEAVTNMKLQVQVPTDDSSYKLEDLCYENLGSLGYILADADGNIWLTKDSNGNWNVPTAYAFADENDESKPRNIIDIDPEDSTKAYVMDRETIEKDWNEVGSNHDEIISMVKAYDERYFSHHNIVDGTDYIKNPKTLQNMIMNGILHVINTNKDEGRSLTGDLLESDTNFRYSYDTSDDAAAETKYNMEMKKIEREDNKLDMEMKQLETQHEAILKEYDSVKKVISNNIDRTFNLFSQG